ncbi:MAG: Mur ligase domain-containing protein, partial [Methylocystaceae bacterium]
MNRQLKAIADIVNGELQARDTHFLVNSVSIDSRKSSSGTLFFALPGTHHDGHDFVTQILASGGAAVVNRNLNG